MITKENIFSWAGLIRRVTGMTWLISIFGPFSGALSEQFL
jgi:hypothetical protein